MIILNFCIAIVGVITGSAGLVLGVLNYLRDRAHVAVVLQWDMSSFGDVVNDGKLKGVVTVTNTGRRCVFLSHVHLEISKAKPLLLISESIAGIKLSEADPPKIYMINQEGLEEFSKDWRKMRAVIIDSTGKLYCSKRVKKCPSWVKMKPHS